MRIEVDVGTLPADARSVVLDYREYGSTGAWIRLGETPDTRSRWDVPPEREVVIRARIRDKRGRIWPGKEERFLPQRPVANRPAPTALTMPAVQVTQDGPTLYVKQPMPEGVDPKEYDIEVATTLTSDSAAKSGTHLGYVKPDEILPVVADTAGQKIWTRPVRIVDDAAGSWSSATVTSPPATIAPTQTHSNGFTGGTYPKLGGASGNAPLEENAGTLRHAAIYIGDADGYIGDHDDIYIGDAGLYWSPGIYQTGNLSVGVEESVVFQVRQDLNAVSRATMYIGDAHFYIGGDPRVDATLGAIDNRLWRLNLTNGADETPLSVEYKVATSSGAAPTFTASDFTTLVPGKVYHNVLTYAFRIVVKTRFNRRITWDNIYILHWIWCRSRWWHTHSNAFELIAESEVTGSAVASVTISGLALDDWDEVRLQVLWKNADATGWNLRVRPNNDTGSNYYKDGAAAASGLVVGASTLGQNWWEEVTMSLVNPVSGAERGWRVESNPRWNATTSETPDAPSVVMWDNTANEITSLVVGTTASGAETPLAVGTIIRLWAKRHHQET